jgi:short subunit dehydrogenase-like uncharacterized protein
MVNKSWLLYGAYGYTGSLVAQQAKERGHEPVLAGRSEEKLISVAKRLDLDYVVFNLKHEDNIYKIIKDFDLLFHSAWPYK